MDYQIVPLNACSEEVLAPLMEASFAHWVQEGCMDEPDVAAWRRYLSVDDPTRPCMNYVVLHQGVAVGMECFAEIDFPRVPEFTPWLTNLYVMPAHRGRGLARLLQTHCLKELQTLGFENVFLRPFGGSEKFHESHGFQMFDTPRRIMRKEI